MKKVIILCLLLMVTLCFSACKENSSATATIKATPTKVPTEVPAATVEPTSTPIPTEKVAATPVPPREAGKEAGGIKDGEYTFTPYKGAPDTPVPLELSTGDIGIHFYATASFDYLLFGCPNWMPDNLAQNGSNFTAYLYAWAGSYESTVGTTELKKVTFEDYKNNENLKFEIALEEGEYLVLLTEAEGRASIWADPVITNNFECYQSDVIIESTCAMTIHYTKTPTNPLGVLS